jgi:hypothetical protein
MVSRKKSTHTKQPDSDSDQNSEVTLDSAGQVAVTYSAKPPEGPPAKQIHPRRRLPNVPDAPLKKGGSE